MSGNPDRLPDKGFSLIELLVVIAIMMVIAALTVPVISSTLNGIKIADATQTVSNEIQVARATALARNAPVEIWFLKEGSYYGAVRTLIVNADNEITWISRTRRLPEGIAMAGAAKFSNILGLQTAETPPESAASLKGVFLRIFPSGRLEPGDPQAFPSNDPLFLTLVSVSGFDPDSDDSLPDNFATIQIDPSNSRTITHRP